MEGVYFNHHPTPTIGPFAGITHPLCLRNLNDQRDPAKARCWFPFKYKGKVYTDCTMTDNKGNGVPWQGAFEAQYHHLSCHIIISYVLMVLRPRACTRDVCRALRSRGSIRSRCQRVSSSWGNAYRHPLSSAQPANLNVCVPQHLRPCVLFCTSSSKIVCVLNNLPMDMYKYKQVPDHAHGDFTTIGTMAHVR